MDMSIDDLINNALKVNGQHVGATGLYAVVSNVNTKELYLLDLQDFFSENMLHFSNGTTAAVILMGIYSNEEQAWLCIENLRELGHPSPGILHSRDLHLLMSNPVKNELYPLSLMDYYVGCMAFYLYDVDSGNLPLALFSTKDAAEAAIDFVRYHIRDEDR